MPLPDGWEAAEAIVGEKRVGGKVKYLCTFKGYGDEQFICDEVSKELKLDWKRRKKKRKLIILGLIREKLVGGLLR